MLRSCLPSSARPPPDHSAVIAAMSCTALGGAAAVQAGRVLRALSVGRRAGGCTQLGSPPGRRSGGQPSSGQRTGRPPFSRSLHRPAAAMEAGLPPEIEHTVERIHCSPLRIVLYLGGGASQVGRRPPAAPLPPGRASP